MNKIGFFGLAVGVMTLLSACSDSDITNTETPQQRNKVTFTASLLQPTSRASLLTSLPDKVGLTAYTYEGTMTAKEWALKEPNFMVNDEASTSVDNTTMTILPSKDYFWTSGTYNSIFYGFGPYDALKDNTPTSTTTGCFALKNVQIQAVDDQQDLILAQSSVYRIDANTNPTIELPFKHLLTAIQFKQAETTDTYKGTLEAFTIKGVYSRGDYMFTYDDDQGTLTGAWTNQNNTTVEFSTENKDNIFLMLPQTLPDDAKIIIRYADFNTNKHYLVYNLKGKTWKPGTRITYTVNFKTNTLEPTITPWDDTKSTTVDY